MSSAQDGSSEFDKLSSLAGLFEFDRLFLLALGLAVLILIAKGIDRLANRGYALFPVRRLLISQVATCLNFFLYTAGGTFLVYVTLQPPRELLIAIGGGTAVALGLALKDLVSSVIAGFILLFDRPFQVGDRVTFAGEYGEISSIGLRAVRLITLDDNEVTIPNNRFMTDVVASGNAGALDMMVVVSFHLALDADAGKARALLHEIVVTSRYVYLKKPVALILSEVTVAHTFSLLLQAKAYVLDVRFEKAFMTDVTLRAQRAFLEHGIKRPQGIAAPPLQALL